MNTGSCTFEKIKPRHVVLRTGSQVHDVHMFGDMRRPEDMVSEAVMIAGIRLSKVTQKPDFLTEPAADATRRHVQVTRRNCGFDTMTTILARRSGNSGKATSSLWRVTQRASLEDIGNGRPVTLNGRIDGRHTSGKLTWTGSWVLTPKDARPFLVRIYDGPVVVDPTTDPELISDHDLAIKVCVAAVDRAVGKASAEGIRNCHEAHRYHFGRYAGLLRDLGFQPVQRADEPGLLHDRVLALSHALWMCDEMLSMSTSTAIDKMARWMGCVQTIIAFFEVSNFRTERDATRRLFSLSPLSVDLLT